MHGGVEIGGGCTQARVVVVVVVAYVCGRGGGGGGVHVDTAHTH